MKSITIYNEETGEIRLAYSQQMDFTDEQINALKQENESHIEGWFSNKTHKIENNNLVEKITEFKITLDDIRLQRNALLKGSDWTQVADSPLSNSKKTEWATYRTQLRNLPSSYDNDDDITDVTWPTKPS
tara:strand:- start:259 stop:648 length:390 start_codon:yes stop_codon:yes gene_type:complete